ncbi:hypothetical protein JTB14_029500 [Gonioctena quinquepunctata]|nr:hypothetical protein JTB14_029500 [Gonioctena quinquepunctata]
MAIDGLPDDLDPSIDPKLKLYEHDLACADNVKFSRLTFDKTFTWDTHVNELALRCKKALSPSQIVVNINWECDRGVLLKIHKSKMEYGCIVYDFGPHASAEASVPPLNIRRNQLLAKYCTGIWAHPNHEDDNDIYERRPTITRPADVCLKDNLDYLYNILLQASKCRHDLNTPKENHPKRSHCGYWNI